MDIKFDKMNLGTSLMQEYIKANEGLSELYEDYQGTIKKKPSPITWTFKSTEEQHSKQNHLRKAQELVALLQQNASLIIQLEYNIRNIPIEDSKVQLDLIIKKLKCCSRYYGKKWDDNDTTMVLMHDKLLYFGILLERSLYSSVKLYNISKETAVITHLFAKLCNQAGIQSVTLTYVEEGDFGPATELALKEFCSGTVAVVSEDADVDSAVDTFLSASTETPWCLRKILVQESIYQQFKDALSWKCKLMKQEGEPQASNVSCSKTLTYNAKVFLIDPVDLTKYQKSIVTVEAYRTRKEMISLLEKYNTPFLSLWANGIAEINEVTFSTTLPMVWVNNLADFRGPPQVSEAVYSNIYGKLNDINELNIKIRKCDKITKFCEMSKTWKKLNFERRLDSLCCALDKCMLEDPTNEISYNVIKNDLCNYVPESFVDVGKDYVCIGMSEPLGIIGIENNNSFFTFENFRSLLYGNALVVYKRPQSKGSPSFVFDLIEQAGVPLVHVDLVEGDFKVQAWRPVDHRIKVVWTNSGTIFAN